MDASVNASPEALFVLRRLGLTVSLKKSTDIDGRIVHPHVGLAFYSQIAQVCHMGDFEEATLPGLYGDNWRWPPRMLFGGRRRPPLVNTSLLRHWVEICEKDHEGTCCDFEQLSTTSAE